MNEKYILVECSPGVEEYQKLRDAVGWGNVEYVFTKRLADRPGMFRIWGK